MKFFPSQTGGFQSVSSPMELRRVSRSRRTGMTLGDPWNRASKHPGIGEDFLTEETHKESPALLSIEILLV